MRTSKLNELYQEVAQSIKHNKNMFASMIRGFIPQPEPSAQAVKHCANAVASPTNISEQATEGEEEKKPRRSKHITFSRAVTDGEALSVRLMKNASLKEIESDEVNVAGIPPPRHRHRRATPGPARHAQQSPHYKQRQKSLWTYEETEPYSFQPGTVTKLSPAKSVEDCDTEVLHDVYARSRTPPSANTYDDSYLNARAARTWGLKRPEDKIPTNERRQKKHRLAPQNVWLRELNTATIELDYSRVLALFREASQAPRGNRLRLESAEQLESLARCCVVKRDWRTLAILLGCSKLHIESEKEVIYACRDVVAQGVAGTLTMLSAQQMCVQLVMCSISKLPRGGFDPNRLLKMEELVIICRNDDVISLALAAIDFKIRSICMTEQDFCEMLTKVQVAPSRLVHTCPVASNENDDEDIGNDLRFITPPHAGETHNFMSRDTDEDIQEYYAAEVIPQSINGRYATLHEFACMVGAPRCSFFLNELASRRITLN